MDEFEWIIVVICLYVFSLVECFLWMSFWNFLFGMYVIFLIILLYFIFYKYVLSCVLIFIWWWWYVD